jgi:hypothetical protein
VAGVVLVFRDITKPETKKNYDNKQYKHHPASSGAPAPPEKVYCAFSSYALTNTNILMLRNGREIFSGTGKELIESDDSYIQNFIRGTELLPERAESRE